MSAGVEMSFQIGQRVRHQDYQGKRVTGVVRAVSAESDGRLMVSCVLDEPIVIPAGYGYGETRIHHQHAPAHEFTPFDGRDELIAEMLEALKASEEALRYLGSTLHADRCKEVIAKATGGAA